MSAHPSGRKIIVGDVHGCFVELKALLTKLNYDPLCDLLYFTGDLINKGPASYEVFECALALNAIVVAGNHELRFLEAVKSQSVSQFPSFQKMQQNWSTEQLELICAWIESLPLFYECRDFLLVHAGLSPGIKAQEESAKNISELRTLPNGRPWHDYYTEKKCIVYGHWALQGLCLKSNSIGLDSGCVYGQQLSAVVFPSREIIQVPGPAKPFS